MDLCTKILTDKRQTSKFTRVYVSHICVDTMEMGNSQGSGLEFPVHVSCSTKNSKEEWQDKGKGLCSSMGGSLGEEK